MNPIKAKKNSIHLIAFSFLFILSSCVKEIDPYTPPDPNTPVENINDRVVDPC